MIDPSSLQYELAATADAEQMAYEDPPTLETSSEEHHGIQRLPPKQQQGFSKIQVAEKAEVSSRFLVEERGDGSFPLPSQDLISTSHKRSSNLGIRRLWSSCWVEASGSVLMLLVFIALVITLEEFENQPQPNWPYGFSINTLVSVYTTLFKLPLMLIASECLGQSRWRWFRRRKQPLKHIEVYENALRGDPIGVIGLIWATRGRHLTATIGAVISLAALVVDPFSQAIITIYPCQVPDASSNGSVPRANTLQIPQTLPLEMQHNMLATILGVGSFEVKPRCQSGNCTFDQEYHSVGVCSSCTDISNQLQRNCTIPGDSQPQVSATLPSCRWFLQHTDPGDGGENPNYIGFETSLPVQGGDRWKVVNYEVASYSVNHTIAWIADPPRAVSCSVKPCVKSYKSAVVNGSFSERLLRTSQVWPDQPRDIDGLWGVIYSRMLNRDCLPPSAKQALIRQNIDITPEWISYNYTIFNSSALTEPRVLPGMAADPAIPDECLYQYMSYEMAEFDPIHNTISWFATQFKQPLTAWAFFNETNLTGGISSAVYDLNGKAPPMYWINGLEANQSSTMVALYRNGSITSETVAEMFDNVATTMTNFARSSPDALLDGNELNLDVTPAQTPELLQDSCIQINWPWLTLPAVLMLLSMLFLVLTVAQSALPNSAGIWKSSPLALLWHGFEVPQPTDSTSDDLKTIETMSSDMRVQLQQTALGWKLVQ